MTTTIIFLIVGIIVDILIVWWEKKDSQTPFKQEWKLDEGVTPANEHRAIELLMTYSKKEVIALDDSFIIHKNIKDEVVAKPLTVGLHQWYGHAGRVSAGERPARPYRIA